MYLILTIFYFTKSDFFYLSYCFRRRSSFAVLLASFFFFFFGLSKNSNSRHDSARKGEPGVVYSSEVTRAEPPCICPKSAKQVPDSGLVTRSLVTMSSVIRHIQVPAWSSSSASHGHLYSR